MLIVTVPLCDRKYVTCSYMEIHPNALATELARMIMVKTGHKYLIIKTKIFFRRKVPSLRADLLVGGDTVRLFAVHLQTSGIAQLRHRFRKDYDRDAPVEQILGELEHNSSIRAGQVGEIRAEMDASPYPVILAGDFNDTPSSYTYRTMKGDMTDGFRDSGSGYGGTFRYLGGVLRIDYIFYDDAFEGIRYYMPPEDVSDHKAVVAELRFR